MRPRCARPAANLWRESNGCVRRSARVEFVSCKQPPYSRMQLACGCTVALVVRHGPRQVDLWGGQTIMTRNFKYNFPISLSRNATRGASSTCYMSLVAGNWHEARPETGLLEPSPTAQFRFFYTAGVARGRGKTCLFLATKPTRATSRPTKPMRCWPKIKGRRSSTCAPSRNGGIVGAPDLSDLDKTVIYLHWWQMYPPLQTLPNFVETLTAELRTRGVDESDPLLFLCRSGARSRAAAIAMTAAGWKSSYNIADGFEGPLDSARHRGAAGGWKAGGAAMDTDLTDA